MPDEDGELKRDLNLFDAIATNAGTVIGTGIFAVPAFIAADVTHPLLIFAVFVAGGILSILGGLTFSELAASVPRAGGLYAWLKDTMGDEMAFLYAWTNLAVAQTAGIAAVAIFVSESMLRMFHGYGPWIPKLVAVNLIGILAVVNYVGVKRGGQVQSISFVAKVVGIVAFIGAVFILVPFEASGLSGIDWTGFSVGPALFGAFSVAMISSLWAYDGWFQVTMVAEEVQDPGENLPKSIILGLGIVMVVYLVFVLAILWALGPQQMGVIGQDPNAVVSVDAALVTAGVGGLVFLSLAAMVSGIGTNNAQVMTAPRLTFAMARDKLFIDPVEKVHESFSTPHRAIVLITAIAITYTLLGTFELLITLVIFTLWFFYAAGGVTLFLYRRQQPDMDRPYTVPGYPVVPAVFVGVAAVMLVGQILGAPVNSAIGAAIVLAGLPFYGLWQLHRSPGALPWVDTGDEIEPGPRRSWYAAAAATLATTVLLAAFLLYGINSLNLALLGALVAGIVASAAAVIWDAREAREAGVWEQSPLIWGAATLAFSVFAAPTYLLLRLAEEGGGRSDHSASG